MKTLRDYGLFRETSYGRTYVGGLFKGWPTDTEIRKAARKLCCRDYAGIIEVHRGQLYVCAVIGEDGLFIETEVYLGRI